MKNINGGGDFFLAAILKPGGAIPWLVVSLIFPRVFDRHGYPASSRQESPILSIVFCVILSKKIQN
jgi:hypothetical protein